MTYRFISVVILTLVCVALPGLAQEDDTAFQEEAVRAVFTADKGAPLIGEPVALTLTVEVDTQRAALEALPEFPEEWGAFVVREAGEVTESDFGSSRMYQQTLAVILWEPGEYTTPETYVSVRDLSTGQLQQVRVQDSFFTVATVLDGTDLELRPLKPPIWLEYVSPLVTMGAVLAFSSVTAGLIWLLRRRWSAARLDEDASPIHQAVRRLDGFAREGLPAVLLYPLVADCLREYLQNRYAVRAQDMTTEELIHVLDETQLMPDRLTADLRRILEGADLVKFAGARPGKTSAQQLLLTARDWLGRAESFAPGVEAEKANA